MAPTAAAATFTTTTTTTTTTTSTTTTATSTPTANNATDADPLQAKSINSAISESNFWLRNSKVNPEKTFSLTQLMDEELARKMQDAEIEDSHEADAQQLLSRARNDNSLSNVSRSDGNARSGEGHADNSKGLVKGKGKAPVVDYSDIDFVDIENNIDDAYEVLDGEDHDSKNETMIDDDDDDDEEDDFDGNNLGISDYQFALELQKTLNIAELEQCDIPAELSSELGLHEPNNSFDDSDLALARALQDEFDREQRTMLHGGLSSHAKISVTDSFFSAPDKNKKEAHRWSAKEIEEYDYEDSDDEENDSDEESMPLNVLENGKPTKPIASGAPEPRISTPKRIGLNSVSKHDATVCGLRNAKKMERFPPNFQTGNVRDGSELKINGKAYNALVEHSKKEESHRQRRHGHEEIATTEKVLDAKTRLILYRMVNNGTLKEVHGIVSAGKEANIYHAFGGEGETEDSPDAISLPDEVAIKIFKTTLNEFRDRNKYIEGDFRFSARQSRQNPRKLIKIWAEKEMSNLLKLQAAGINCPEPLLLRNQVLIMTFLGKDGVPSPKLKEVDLTEDILTLCYASIIEMMRTMYSSANLVHADLSEYNIMYHDKQPYFIDVAQAVDYMHPNALVFLHQDVTNVTKFFATRLGASNIMSVRELFHHVSSIEIQGDDDMEFLSILQDERAEIVAHDTLY